MTRHTTISHSLVLHGPEKNETKLWKFFYFFIFSLVNARENRTPDHQDFRIDQLTGVGTGATNDEDSVGLGRCAPIENKNSTPDGPQRSFSSFSIRKPVILRGILVVWTTKRRLIPLHSSVFFSLPEFFAMHLFFCGRSREILAKVFEGREGGEMSTLSLEFPGCQTEFLIPFSIVVHRVVRMIGIYW